MQTTPGLETCFQVAGELTRLLVHAGKGTALAQSRHPMELMAMHVLPGRLRYATYRQVYSRLSTMARAGSTELDSARLWAELLDAQAHLTREFKRKPVCPSTRNAVLLQCLLDQPVLIREHIASSANVSTETAGRWMRVLAERQLVVRVEAGNIAVYFVRGVVVAALREAHRQLGRPTDDITMLRILGQRVVVPMDPYRFPSYVRSW